MKKWKENRTGYDPVYAPFKDFDADGLQPESKKIRWEDMRYTPPITTRLYVLFIRKRWLLKILLVFILLFLATHPDIYEGWAATQANQVQLLIEKQKQEIMPKISNSPTEIKHIDNKTLEIEKAVLEHVNKERLEYDRPPLIWNDWIAAKARNHSLDMVQRNFFAHSTGHYGENIGQIPTGSVEGCGYVYDSPDGVAGCVVSSWMESPGHRRNILTYGYGYSGVGVARDSAGTYYITQIFW